MEKKSGRKTLFMSMLMSAPGPLILAWGLTLGSSATQMADLTRRSAELAAIVVAFAVYCITEKDEEPARKARLERRANLLVGAAMCLGGAAMLLIALLLGKESQGSSVPGLVIAILGVVANTLFWRKYTRLGRETGNAILAVQGRLYRAKSLVDMCVTIALMAVTLAPGSAWAARLDQAGSSVVAAYLIWCGLRTIRESLQKIL